MTDLICVDFAAQDDLMLWDQLARGILERTQSGRRMLVLIGSSEAQERRLDVAGHPTRRTDGALTLSETGLDTSMRESVRTVTNRLTDEGVYAVGMLAADRGLVHSDGTSLRCSARFERRVWTGPGVVPVLGCFVSQETGLMQDVHPVHVASAVAEALDGEARILVLARRKTSALAGAMETGEAVSVSKLAEEGAFHPHILDLLQSATWHASHVTGIATGQAAKVR